MHKFAKMTKIAEGGNLSATLQGGGNMSCRLKKFAVLVAAVMMGAMMPSFAATNTTWNDDPDNRGTEADPVNLYDAGKWASKALPSSSYNLTITAGGLTYITNTAPASTKIAERLRFGGGDFVVLGPMEFNSLGVSVEETAPVSIDKRGDWTCTKGFRLATSANSSFTFTNRTGKLDICFNNDYARIGYGNNSTASFVLEDGAVTCGDVGNFSVGYGTGSKAYFEQNGGTVSINRSLNIGYNGAGELTINNGTFTVEGRIYLGDQGTDSSGNITLNGGTLETKRIECGASLKGGTILFNGGTLKANGTFSAGLVSDDSYITVQLGASGGTIDNNGLAITIPCTITGAGGLTLSGAGTTMVSADQSYTGTTTVSSGTTIAVSGVTFAGSLALEAGSTMNIVSYDGTTPLALPLLTLPSEGVVNLTLDGGAFSKGVYAICSAPGVAVEDGAKFTFTTEGDLVGNWSIEDDALVLTVGEILDNMWTGRGGDFRMSNGANWGGGEVPAADADIDLSFISANTTIIADADRTFGAVKMGADVITFTGSLSATSFISEETHNPTAKIAVGENSTVTLVGDLVFATNSACYVCYSIAEGGTFAVTGDIIATEQQTKNVLPCNQKFNEGVISAKGLVSRIGGEAFGLASWVSGALAKWVIGEDGLSGAEKFYVGTADTGSSATAMITATTNFTVSVGIDQFDKLVFDPAGYEITLGTNTLAKSGGILSGRAKGLTTVTGTGKVVVNYNVEHLANYAQNRTNAFTVTSSATLAFKPGANIGLGALTVQDGGTLEVAESGTVTHKGALTLDSGAVLAFNFTERGVVPRLALASGSPTVSGAVTVKVSSDNNLWPTCGEKLLTTCGGFRAEGVEVSLAAGAPKWAGGVSVNPDGNIVFCVKPKPTVIVIR